MSRFTVGRESEGRLSLPLAFLFLRATTLTPPFGQSSAARGVPVPETPQQRQWVIGFARLLTPV